MRSVAVLRGRSSNKRCAAVKAPRAAVKLTQQHSKQQPSSSRADCSACRAEACYGYAIICNHLVCVRVRAHSMLTNAKYCVCEAKLTSINHYLHLTTGKPVEAAAAAAPRTVPAPRTVHNSTPQNTCMQWVSLEGS